VFSTSDSAFGGLKVLERMQPERNLVENYERAYDGWRTELMRILQT